MIDNKNAANVELGLSLSDERRAGIRRTLELNHCKWDAQVGNQTALASAPLSMTRPAWRELSSLATQLFNETVADKRQLNRFSFGLARGGRACSLGSTLRSPVAADIRALEKNSGHTSLGHRPSEWNHL